MKLLFDQNLSHRLCRLLEDIFPEADQVKATGLDRSSDATIWEFAREAGFTIVTLDSDFADIAALRGAPPKVVWLRCGNQPTDRNDCALVARSHDAFERFRERP